MPWYNVKAPKDITDLPMVYSFLISVRTVELHLSTVNCLYHRYRWTRFSRLRAFGYQRILQIYHLSKYYIQVYTHSLPFYIYFTKFIRPTSSYSSYTYNYSSPKKPLYIPLFTTTVGRNNFTKITVGMIAAILNNPLFEAS